MTRQIMMLGEVGARYSSTYQAISGDQGVLRPMKERMACVHCDALKHERTRDKKKKQRGEQNAL